MPPRNTILKSQSSTARGPSSTASAPFSPAPAGSLGLAHSHSQSHHGAAAATGTTGPNQSRFARLHGITAVQQRQQQQQEEQSEFVANFVERRSSLPPSSSSEPEGGALQHRQYPSTASSAAVQHQQQGPLFAPSTSSAITATNYLQGAPAASTAQQQSLEQRLRAQQHELELRTDNVNAVQRNFERLSQLHAKDRRSLEEATAREAALLAELESLRAERKVSAIVRAEFAALQEAHERAEEGLKGAEVRAAAAERLAAERLAVEALQWKAAEEGLSAELRAAEARAGRSERRLEGSRRQRKELIAAIFGDYAKKLRRIGGHAASIIDAMECAVDAHLVAPQSQTGASSALDGGGATDAEINSTGEALKAFLQRGISPPMGAARRSSAVGTSGLAAAPQHQSILKGSATQQQHSSSDAPLPVLQTIAPTPSRRGIGADLTEAFSATKYSGLGTSTDHSTASASAAGLLGGGGNDSDADDTLGVSSDLGRSSNSTGAEASSSNEGTTDCIVLSKGGKHHLTAAAAAPPSHPQHSGPSGSRQSSFKRRNVVGGGGGNVRKSVSYASGDDDGGEGGEPRKASSSPFPAPLNPSALSETRPLSGPSQRLASDVEGEGAAKTKQPQPHVPRRAPFQPQRPRGGTVNNNGEDDDDDEDLEAAAEGPAASVSPSRGRRRLGLLSSQFAALEGALAACEAEVLPCIVQYLRHGKAVERRVAQQHRSETDRLRAALEAAASERGGLEELSADLRRQIASLEAQVAAAAAKRKSGDDSAAEDRFAVAAAEASATAERWRTAAEAAEARLQTLEEALADARAESERVRIEMAAEAEQQRSDAAKSAAAAKTSAEAAAKEAIAREALLKAEAAKAAAELKASHDADVAALTADLNAARAAADSGEGVAASRIAALTAELAASKEASARALEAAEAASKKTVETLSGTITELKCALEEAEARAAALSDDRDGLSADLSAATADAAEAVTREGVLRKEKSALSIDLKTAQEQLALATARAAKDLEAARHGYEAQLAALAADAEAGRRRAEEAEGRAAAAYAARDAAERRALEASASAEISARQTAEALRRERDDLAAAARRAETQMARVRSLHEESSKAVAKLMAAERSGESSCSCQSCLAVVKSPVVCAPCGHMFCRSCLEGANNGRNVDFVGAGRGSGGSSPSSPLFCPECSGHTVQCVAPSPQMDALASKLEYRQRVLADLAALVASAGKEA